jgi:type I restriction enzyme, S subunit
MKKGWKIEKLSELCTVFDDGDWIERKDQSNNGIRLIQTGNIGIGFFKDRVEKARYISEDTFRKLKCTEIFKNDCLISRLPDPVGRACILPDTGNKMITAVDCTIIRFDEKKVISKWFLFYSLSERYQTEINEQISGATRQRISRKNLGQIKIPLVALSEQKHIVAILDEVFADIEKAKNNAEQNLKNSKELFESYLQGVFEKRDEGWETKKLTELFNVQSSKRVHKKDWKNKGVPFYRAREVVKLARDGFVNNELFISQELYNLFTKDKGAPKEDDIIISAVGTLGECYLVKRGDKFYIKDASVLWFAKISDVNSRYIEYSFKSNIVKSQVMHKSMGATVGTLTITRAKNIEINMPSLKVQNEIVQRLDTFTSKIIMLEKNYQKKIEDFDELKKGILARAFSGEL